MQGAFMTETSISPRGPRPGLAAAFNWAKWQTWGVFFGFAIALGAASALITIGATLLVASIAASGPESLEAQTASAIFAGILHLFALLALDKATGGRASDGRASGADQRGFLIREIVSYPKDRLFLLPWIFLIWMVIYGVNALSLYTMGIDAGMALAFGAVIIVIGMEYPIRVLEKLARPA